MGAGKGCVVTRDREDRFSKGKDSHSSFYEYIYIYLLDSF